MSGRLTRRLERLKAEGRAGLVTYVMAGDPNPAQSLATLHALARAGADVIELGFPFTDPMADGPSIQKAGLRALEAGMTLAKTLALIARFRADDPDTPVILMGYANPVAQLGEARFAQDAAKAGADGAIIVDLPPEEDQTLRTAMTLEGLSLIRLASPTTDATRLPAVLDGVSGFVYYVSVTGVTGRAAPRASDVASAVARLKAATSLPIAVGFGVRTPEAAAEIAASADLVVVGSALVDAGAHGDPGGAAARVEELAASLAAAVRTARTGAHRPAAANEAPR